MVWQVGHQRSIKSSLSRTVGLIRGYMNIIIRVQARQAAAQLAQVKGALKQVQGAHISAAGAVGKHEGKLQAWLRTGTKVGNQLQWTGRQLEYNWTLPLGAAAVAATKWYMANEAAMTRVRKVYGDFDLADAIGADGVQRELDALERSFVALSNQYGQQQEDVIAIGAAWAAAGASGVALARSTELTLKAMVLGEMDAEKATKALISIQSQWHLSTQGMNDTLAELNVIENQTAVSMNDLIEAFTRTSGVARTAGITTRELGAMIAALVPATGSAANAGNALKTIISRLLAPTNEAREVMSLMGIEISKSSWQSLSATKRLEKLSETFAGLSAGQRVAVSTSIASRWQLNRFEALMDALSNKNSYYTKALEATADKTNYLKIAQQELNAVLNSDPQRLKQIWVILQNAASKVIQPLIPTILMLTGEVAKLATAFSNLDPYVIKMIALAALLLAAIGPVARYLGSIITLVHVLGGAFAFLLSPFGKITKLFGTLGKSAGGATAAANGINAVSKASKGMVLGSMFLTAGKALTAFWKKFDVTSQIKGRLTGLLQMAGGLVGLIGVAGKRVAQGGGPVVTRKKPTGMGDKTVVNAAQTKNAAKAQTMAFTGAMHAGLFAFFNGIGSTVSKLFKGLGRGIITALTFSLKALPGILLRAILGPVGIVISIVLAACLTFRDQIAQIFSNIGSMLAGPWNAAISQLGGSASFISKFIAFIKNAFWSLPVEVQNAMIAVVNVVSNAAKAVYEWFSYINPFARHSPSLVENVEKGMSDINSSFGTLSNIKGPIDKAYAQIKRLKQLAGSFMDSQKRAEQKEQMSKLGKVAPRAVAAYKALVSTMNSLQSKLDVIEPKIRKQEQVVKRWQTALDAVNKEIDEQNEKLDDLRETADEYSDAISAAQDKINDLASAPLVGMGEMEDQIFANTQEQNRLRLEMMKMEDAGKTYDDVRDKVAQMAGEIESLQATQIDLRQAGAGSEILGFYDEEAKKLKDQKVALEGSMGPYEELQKQLDELQRKSEMLDLEKALKFDGPIREIDKLANAQKELSFEEIIAQIKEQRAIIDTYTPKLNEVNKQIALQEAVIKRLEDRRKSIQKTYDTENEKLEKMKDLYQEISSAISDAEEALNSLSSAADKSLADKAAKKSKKAKDKEWSPAAQAFLESKDANFPIQGDPNAKIGREGGNKEQTSQIDAFTKEITARTEAAFGSLDVFKPLKDKWNKVVVWFKKNIQPAWGPIKEGVKGVFEGVDWGAPVRQGTALRGVIDGIRDAAVKVWAWLKNFGGIMARLFGPDFKLMFTELADAFKTAWSDIKEAFDSIDWGSFKIIIGGLLKIIWGLVKVVGAILIVALKAVTSILARVLGPAIKLISGLFKAAIKIIMGVVDVIAALFDNDWGRLGQGLQKIREGLVDAVWEGVAGAFKLIGGLLEGLLNIIPDMINAIFKTDLPSVRELVSKIVKWIGSLREKLPNVLKGVWDKVVGFFTGLYDTLVGHSIVPDTINAIVRCFAELPGRLWAWLKKTGKSVEDRFNSILNWVKNTWSKGWAGVTNVFKHPVKSAKAAVGALLGKAGMRDSFVKVRSWVKDTWSKGWSAVDKTIRNPVGQAKKGVDVILGKTGMRDSFNRLYSWFKETWIGKHWVSISGKIKKPLAEAKNYVHDVLVGKKSIKQVFSDATGAIGKAWDKVKAQVKDPIKFVINTILEDGILKAFRKIGSLVGMNTKDWHVGTGGWKTGGYTGKGDPSKVAGQVHFDEQVIKSPSRRSAERELPGGLDYLNKTGKWPVGPSAYTKEVNQQTPRGKQLPIKIAGLPVNIRQLAKNGPGPGDNSGFGSPVSWGMARKGQYGWYQRCLEFVNKAWGTSVGRFRMATARASMNAGPRTMKGRPPAGAGVYWDTGKWGHIALAVGNGTVLSNDIRAAGRIDQVPQKEINKWGPYRGWWHPKGKKGGPGGLLDVLPKFNPVAVFKKFLGRTMGKLGNTPAGGIAASIAKKVPHKLLTGIYDNIKTFFKGKAPKGFSPAGKSADEAAEGLKAYARGTMGARRGMGVVGENGPELMKIPGGSKVLSNPSSVMAISKVLDSMITVSFTRAMSTASGALEDSVVANVGAAMRRAERRMTGGDPSRTVGTGEGRPATMTVVIQKAVFPNVKTSADAKEFLDNLENVS